MRIDLTTSEIGLILYLLIDIIVNSEDYENKAIVEDCERIRDKIVRCIHV